MWEESGNQLILTGVDVEGIPNTADAAPPGDAKWPRADVAGIGDCCC